MVNTKNQRLLLVKNENYDTAKQNLLKGKKPTIATIVAYRTSYHALHFQCHDPSTYCPIIKFILTF